MAPVRLLIVGAGNRGSVYATYALEKPELCKVVGVAEPRDYVRETFAARHGLAPDAVYKTWEDLAARPGLRDFADAVVIATQDRLHTAPATTFGRMGFSVLLEKPMAQAPEDCKAIAAAMKEGGGIFAVGHVLRYTPFMQEMVGLLRSGAIGDVVNIQHLEPIGHFHFAHSYVRGNWRNEDESSFMLLAKACHDVDLLRYMMGSRATAVSSFGGLKHFTPSNKPAGAADRCLDCPSAIESKCPYSAKRIYLERAQADHFDWPVAPILSVAPSVAAVETALREGPYGRCAYSCDNDVCDHQVTNFQFENGATASLSVVAYTKDICKRRIRVFGTLGELDGDGENSIIHHNFVDGSTRTIVTPGAPSDTRLRGHGGADYYLIRAFIDAVSSGDASKVLSGPEETMESHLMTFAAEQARRLGKVVALAPPASAVGGAGVGGAGAAPGTVAAATLEAQDFSW